MSIGFWVYLITVQKLRLQICKQSHQDGSRCIKKQVYTNEVENFVGIFEADCTSKINKYIAKDILSLVDKIDDTILGSPNTVHNTTRIPSEITTSLTYSNQNV